MGLKELLSKIVKPENTKEFREAVQKNPEFQGKDIEKLKFEPIDGDFIRMGMYGCYAGDVYYYNGNWNKITEDQVDRIEVIGDSRMSLRVFSDNMQFGDKIKKGDISYYYEGHAEKHTYVENEYGDAITYVDKTASEIPGTWLAACEEREKILFNVNIPDEVLGRRVGSIEDAFQHCYNVVTVSHLPELAIESKQTYDAFSFSGLRNPPKQLEGENLENACKYAFALNDYERVLAGTANQNFSRIVSSIESIQKLKDDKSQKMELIGDEMSPYQKCSTSTFAYGNEVVKVLLVHDEQNNKFVVAPANDFHVGREFEPMIPYEDFMSRYGTEYLENAIHEDISNEEAKKIISIAYDAMIEKEKFPLERDLSVHMYTREDEFRKAHNVQGDIGILVGIRPVPSKDDVIDIVNRKIARNEIARDDNNITI